MHIRTSVAVVILLLVSPTAGADLSHLQSISDSRYHYVDSETIGRGFHVYVKLPADYAESEDSYPTVYVLDGGSLFPVLASYQQALRFSGDAPAAIVVGISYGSDDWQKGNLRSTDYTALSDEREHWGGAGAFQIFLNAELMPLIEREYRSNAGRRIIFGQSIGGQFVLYTAMTRPKLFWGHIASNPALHRNLAFFLEPQADYGGPTQSKLFIGSGTEDEPRFREPALEWFGHWEEGHGAWQMTWFDLQGHSHMSAPPAAYLEGMRWLFR